MAKTPASDYLEQVKSGPKSEQSLKDLLVARARDLAAAKLGKSLSKRVGPSDIAISAVNSLLKDIKQGKASPGNSDDLFHLLSRRVHNKCVDATRRERAKKRDSGRETSDAALVSGSGETPDMIASADEVAGRVIELLCESSEELRRTVNLLGIIGERSAREIREALEGKEWVEKYNLPGVRSIELWLQAERARLKATLKAEGYIDPYEDVDA